MSIKIMTEVWQLELPHVEKLVLLALADNASDEGKCYPSIATLVAKCSLSERTIQGTMSKLVTGGHLTRHERHGRSTVYHVHPRSACTPQEMHPASGALTPAGDAPSPPQRVRGTPAARAPITVIEPSVEPSPNRQKARVARRRCPEEFQVTSDLRTWAETKHPLVDLDAETAAFRDYEFRNGKTDWPATWRNWIRTAAKDAKPSSQRQRSSWDRMMEANAGE